MILSILIPTLTKRQKQLDALLISLEAQIDAANANELVEVIHCADEGQMTIGAKRNHLMNSCNGDYICFLDDDDSVPVYYVDEILKAVASTPDCIGFKGYMTTNNKNRKDFVISNRYKSWVESKGVYHRHTNHLTPVKRNIAIKCPFPNLRHGEDYAYSMALKAHLKTEVFIDKEMYIYNYISNK